MRFTHLKCVKTAFFIIFILGVGLNNLNQLIFKFLNIFFISHIVLYDSLINFNLLNYFNFFIKKILIGKKFNQFSFRKKTLYLNYFIFLKKFFLFSRLKCGDINYFSRINNELIFLNSYKIFFEVLNNSTISLNSLNILNFFLTYRINFSNIIFITYINCLNIFKMFNCFINKTIIYYMINNNIFYLFNEESFFKFYVFFISESSSFYTEHIYFFNFYDFFLNIIENFLFFKYPKYIVLNNFFYFLNFKNFILFLY